MSKKRAFIKYTKAGELIPGSLIITTSGGFPKDGVYKEVDVDLCCPPVCPECPECPIQCTRWKYIGDGMITILGAVCGGFIGCGDLDIEPNDEICLLFACNGTGPSGPDWIDLGLCTP